MWTLMGRSFDGSPASDPGSPSNAEAPSPRRGRTAECCSGVAFCRIIPLQIQWLRAYPTVQLIRLPILVWLTLWVLAGCQTDQQRKAAENAAVNRQAADEITRICALHGAEREAQLKKLKAASGLDLYCPGE